MEVKVSVNLGIAQKHRLTLLTLRPPEGEKELVIVCDPAIFERVQIYLANIPVRQMTHDFFLKVVGGLGATVKKVVVTGYDSIINLYHATTYFESAGNLIAVEGSPSDAIALALLANAPIYAESELLETMGQQVLPSPQEPLSPAAGIQPTDDVVGPDLAGMDELFSDIPKQ